MTRLLVGAGGHAKQLAEMLEEAGQPIDAYLDPRPQDWLAGKHLAERSQADALKPGKLVLGHGGVKPGALQKRLGIFRSFLEKGWEAPPLVHKTATIAASAVLGKGVVILAGATVQPCAVIGDGVIINTGAIVEHDSQIGEGTHIAPGAIVLGGCSVGKNCMIGAGSVILQGVAVPDGILVKALTRYPL